MPSAYDLTALKLDRDPLRQLDTAPGKLPTLNPATLWAEWLKGLKTLTGLDLSSPLALVESLGDIIGGALNPDNFIGVLSQVFGYVGAPLASIIELANWVGRTVFGPLDPRRLFNIPLGSIVRDAPNLLTNGSFTDAASVDDPTALWVRDIATYRSPQASVRTSADGTIHELLTVDAIPVTAGQKLDISGYTRWAFLVAGSQAISLGLVVYSDAGEQTLVPIAAVASPTGTQSAWQRLEGQYTVPDGVTSLRVRLVVDQVATEGTVWFDDLSVSLGSNRPQIDWIEGLTSQLASAFANAAAAAQAFGDFLGDQWQRMLNGIKGGVGGAIEDLVDKLRHLTPSGLFDASRLTNMLNFPAIDIGKILDLSDELAWLGDNIGDVFDNVRDTWNAIWRGGTGDDGAVGKGPADVQVVIGQQRERVITAQEAAITLANMANAPKNVPIWVSVNPFEDVTFPRADLRPEKVLALNTRTMSESGTTLNSATETGMNSQWRPALNAHRHDLVQTIVRPRATIFAGTIALAYIRVTADRIVNVVGFAAGGDAPPPTALNLALYEMDVSTGNLTLIHDLGDQKGIVPVGPDDVYNVNVLLPENMVVAAGTMFAVALQPVGGSFTVGAIGRQHISSDQIVFPTAATDLLTGQSGMPQTIQHSALNHTATYRMFASIGQAVATVPEDNSPVTLSATFNEANSVEYTSSSWHQWGTGDSDFGTSNGKLYCHSPLLFHQWLVVQRSAVCVTQVHTNDMGAEVTVFGGFPQDVRNSGGTTRALVRVNSAGTAAVGLVLVSDGNSERTARVAIDHFGSLIVPRGTQRAISDESLTIVDGDKFSIEAVGNVYTCYHNGNPIPGARWVDTGNLAAQGKAWRRVGFGMSATLNGITRSSSPFLDNFVGYDMRAPNELVN